MCGGGRRVDELPAGGADDDGVGRDVPGGGVAEEDGARRGGGADC